MRTHSINIKSDRMITMRDRFHMSQIASRSQLRIAFMRWALFLVPLIMFLGFLSGVVSGSGEDNSWYQMLEKPAFQPPSYVFGVAWTVLYCLMGFAFAIIVSARGARLQILAITVFILQFILNLLWSPIFFGQHQVTTALYLIIFIWLLVAATIYIFSKIRPLAAWLMIPYILWLSFATLLNYQIDSLNPDAETLYAPAARAEISNQIE